MFRKTEPLIIASNDVTDLLETNLINPVNTLGTFSLILVSNNSILLTHPNIISVASLIAFILQLSCFFVDRERSHKI